MSLSVSVVTPSYNQGQFIERTIRSVLDQKIPNLDYLIMDGGSTDDTICILQSYQNQNKLLFVSERDNGQADAVNKAIQKTKGDIIAWLNSDDVYYPNALQKILKIFEENPLIDVIYGDALHINEHDQVLDKYYTEPFNFEQFKRVCFLSQPAVFFRRSLIDHYGFLDINLNYCMDYELWLRFALNGAQFFYLPEILAGSRMYAQNKTLSSVVPVHREINRMQKKILGRVTDRWILNCADHTVSLKWKIKKSNRLFYKSSFFLLACASSLALNKSIGKAFLKEIGPWLK